MKPFKSLLVLLLAVQAISPEASGNNDASWWGFIQLGNQFQLFSASQDSTFGNPLSNIQFANADNQILTVSVDDDDSGDPEPNDFTIEYSTVNKEGKKVCFLGDKDEGYSIDRPSQGPPVYYLFSHAFHRFLRRIVLCGKSQSAHLINPVSPDNSGNLHLELHQNGSSFFITAHPINDQNHIQYNQVVMTFYDLGGLNWGYHLLMGILSTQAQEFFTRNQFFYQSFTAFMVVLLRQITSKKVNPP